MVAPGGKVLPSVGRDGGCAEIGGVRGRALDGEVLAAGPGRVQCDRSCGDGDASSSEAMSCPPTASSRLSGPCRCALIDQPVGSRLPIGPGLRLTITKPPLFAAVGLGQDRDQVAGVQRRPGLRLRLVGPGLLDARVGGRRVGSNRRADESSRSCSSPSRTHQNPSGTGRQPLLAGCRPHRGHVFSSTMRALLLLAVLMSCLLVVVPPRRAA
jgi:hypothetical protein